MKVEKQNKLINKRYKTIVKNLIKLFNWKLKEFKELNLQNKTLNQIQNLNEQTRTLYFQNFMELTRLRNKLFSAFDKAAKKKVIHSNRTNKKKQHFNNQYRQCHLLYNAITEQLAFN